MSGGPSGLVYRDSVSLRPQAELVDELTADLAIARMNPGDGGASVLRALLSAAALEGALADAGDQQGAARLRPICDDLAGRMWNETAATLPALPGPLADWRTGRRLRTSRPESFAYYGLDPRRFAEAATAALPPGERVCVVGIRTIGVALSAACVAALRAGRGQTANRFTVRPKGHPYDRRLELASAEVELVRRELAQGALFLVVDEGPGLSGSSFLATGEALLAAGVPGERVHLFGTRAVHPGTLVSEDAPRRWARFHFAHDDVEPRWRLPGERDLSGGAWRETAYTERHRYPATWPANERRKALSADGRSVRRFLGLARFGDAVHARAAALSGAGWSPPVLAPPGFDGFATFEFVPGRPLDAEDGGPRLAARLGRYLAERSRLFALPAPAPVDQAAFHQMVAANVALTLGAEHDLGVPPPWVRPTIVDGRLAPHEWLATPAGGLIKTDGFDHGDDHLYPGPTDAAWDLAGALVEWQMSAAEGSALVDAYRRGAGDDPGPRLRYFLIAYAAFRARYASMASFGSPPEDSARWQAAERRYVARLRQLLPG